MDYEVNMPVIIRVKPPGSALYCLKDNILNKK